MLLIHLLFLLSATSALNVTLKEGNNEKNVEINCSISENANIARKKLVSGGFISSTDRTHDWRFWKDNHSFDVFAEQYILVEKILSNDRIILINISRKIDSLNIKIGEDKIRTLTMDTNEKLSKVREHLNEDGSLGSESDRCVQWKFLIRDKEYVTDESQLTIAQHLENSRKDQLEITDVYSQNDHIELYVYAGLQSLSLEGISRDMNLFDLHSVLSGTGTCNGKEYNFLNNDWMTLKKTANLADPRISNSDLQISPDLIFTEGEEKFRTVKDAYFRSRNGRFGVEYVSKTSRKRNIIGEVVEKYSRNQSPKVSLRVEKNTNCYNDCNGGITLDPVMLDNVQSTSTAVSFTSRVVICLEGTAIMFSIDTEPKTSFWVKVKHDRTNEEYISTRGDWGKQSYWAYRDTGHNIVVDSHVITREEDLLNDAYMPTFVVEVYELLKPKRRRRDAGDTITVPDGSTNNAKLTAKGQARVGSGSDQGYGPGQLLMEVRFMLLTFKDVATAEEIMGRGVSRH